MSSDGFESESDHYHFNDPVLIVYNSDCDGVPPRAPPIRSYNKNGDATIRVDPGDQHWNVVEQSKRKWLVKLGTAMVQRYLLENLGENSHKKYRLQDFPNGYHFYTTRRPSGRFDHYLYGGRRVFSSPNEFKFHLAWLMCGSPPGRCKCQHCSEEKSQKRLNNEEKAITDSIIHEIQEAKRNNVPITREPNVLNNRAFLKPGEDQSQGSTAESTPVSEDEEDEEIEEYSDEETGTLRGGREDSLDSVFGF